MGRAVKQKPSLSFAGGRASQGPMQCFHRFSVAIFDGNVEAERVVRWWLEELWSHALLGGNAFRTPSWSIAAGVLGDVSADVVDAP